MVQMEKCVYVYVYVNILIPLYTYSISSIPLENLDFHLSQKQGNKEGKLSK